MVAWKQRTLIAFIQIMKYLIITFGCLQMGPYWLVIRVVRVKAWTYVYSFLRFSTKHDSIFGLIGRGGGVL